MIYIQPRQHIKTLYQACIKIATTLSTRYPITLEHAWDLTLIYLRDTNCGIEISYEKVEQEYLKRLKGNKC